MNQYDNFKTRTRFRLEIIVVIVLALVVLLVFLFPRFDREADIKKETSIVFVQSMDVPRTELKKMDIPAPRPALPVMSLDEEIDLSITLEDIRFDDYPDAGIAPPPPPGAITSPDTGFVVYDKAPEAIGGMASISKNIVYPPIAREAGIEGTVIVQSFIDEKGIVRKSVILKGMPGTGLDEAAIAAIEKTKWRPAEQRDRTVGVWIAIPVTFKLRK